MVKKFLYTLINTVSLLIIVAAVAVLVLVLFTPSGRAPQVLGYTMLRVTTGSMEPTYAIDTLIVVKKEAPSAIQEGDIISFYSSDPALDGAVNTHRVTAAEAQPDGSYLYRTKGDANNVEDAYEVHSSYLLGRSQGSRFLTSARQAFPSGRESTDLCACDSRAAVCHFADKPAAYDPSGRKDRKG